jgi:hypothetical protein
MSNTLTALSRIAEDHALLACGADLTDTLAGLAEDAAAAAQDR